MEALIFSDIHANAAALEAILGHETTYDTVVCLGDAVDGGPQPDRVLTLLSDEPGLFIAGNHDRAVLAAGPGSEAKTSDDRLRQWTYNRLSQSNRSFLSTFRSSCVTTLGDCPVQLHHGNFDTTKYTPSYSGRLWPDLDEVVFLDIAAQFDPDRIFHGHSHVQFQRTVEGVKFYNPGSVGQHRLGTVAAQYAVVSDDSIELRAVEYDPTPVIDAMEELPLRPAYIERRKRVYTDGRLPESSSIPSLDHLEEEGYR